jgi:hypothetical protein
MSEGSPTDPSGSAEISQEKKYLSVRQAAFVFTTLIHEPASIITLAVILALSIALDYGWKHVRDTRTKHVQLAN